MHPAGQTERIDVLPVRYAFAGDRDIAVWILDFLLAQSAAPLALLVPDAQRASHAGQLIARCDFLPPERVLRGGEFRTAQGLALLSALDVDYIISIHFPYVYPAEVLQVAREGVLNLHPAYLPYNRGWHTPSWAILEETPIGATLHFMDEGIDTGDIIHQRTLEISPGDTADTLYPRLKAIELEVFREAWPRLATRTAPRTPQLRGAGTAHRRRELYAEAIQRIDLDANMAVGELLRRLRALTTNQVDEAAFYEVDGRRYRVQLRITEEPIAE